ncbi:MAG: ZIP family metal transporter [Candidatus Hydrothermales bacterium]
MEFIGEILIFFSGGNKIILAFIGGVIISFLNLIGASLIFFIRKPSDRLMDTLLGFAAGVMLAASFTSLIIPAINYNGILPVIIGIILGALVLDLGDHVIPHIHKVIGEEGIKRKRLRGVWLLIFAITIHNMPEGLAVGVGFGSGNMKDAIILMLAIGIQNIPEGFSVSVSALEAGYGKKFYSMFVGLRSGLVEIPLAVFGAWFASISESILPYTMGFAAGAMLYVISDEIVPETHRKGHERFATFGTIIGLILMLYLDVAITS